MPPTGRGLVAPPPSGGVGGGGGGGARSASPIGAGGASALALNAGPSGVIGAGAAADLAPASLCLPYRYRSATSLHLALALAPPNTIGELWGPSALIMRAVLASQDDTQRLFPCGPIDFTASPMGAEWNQSGSLDYRWQPIDSASSPTWSASGLTQPLPTGGGIWCPGLARLTMDALYLRATTLATTWAGSPTVVPRIYAGWWRVAAGVSAGLMSGAASGIASSSSWTRAVLTGDPDSPTQAGAVGTLAAPTAEAVVVGSLEWGVSPSSNKGLLSGAWQPPADAAGSPAALTTTQGSSGDAFAAVLGVVAGNGTPPASITWQRLEYTGVLAS